MTRRLTLFFLILVAQLSACSVDTSVADQAVAKFHSLLDTGRFADIYQASSSDLKAVSTEHDFVAFLDAVHRKLGVSGTTEKLTWNVNYHTSGTFVTLTYKTAFREGEATEQFLFRLQSNEALLAGYHVNSNVFILK